MGNKIFGTILIIIGLILAYFIFASFAPYVVSLIPQSDYSDLIKILIYYFIITLGGVGFPLTFVLVGFMFILAGVFE